MTKQMKRYACCGGLSGRMTLLDAETGEPVPGATPITYIRNSWASEEAACDSAERMARDLGYGGLWECQPENEGIEPPFVQQGEPA